MIRHRYLQRYGLVARRGTISTINPDFPISSPQIRRRYTKKKGGGRQLYSVYYTGSTINNEYTKVKYRGHLQPASLKLYNIVNKFCRRTSGSKALRKGHIKKASRVIIRMYTLK